MKPSIYNTILRLDEKASLVYNALSDSFVAVKDSLDRLPQESADIANLREDSPVLYKQLEEIGAFVEDDVDEVEILRQRIDEVDNDDSIFIMHVNPTLDCNFNCWYCYENHQKGSLISDEVVENIISNCRRIISCNPHLERFTLSFFGGEPLLGFPKVKTMLERVSNLCKEYDVRLSVSFTTNGFLFTEEMIEFLKEYECSFQITLDGGREDHNNTRFGKGGIPSYDVILGNILRLIKSELFVTLRINYTSKNFESTSELVSWLGSIPEENRIFLNVDYQRVWQDKPAECIDETYLKVKERRREIESMGFYTSNNRLLHGVSASCYGDKKNYVLVNYDGKLFGCTARDFTEENSIGEIVEDGFRWKDDKVELRRKARFSSPECHKCRIAPLCGGGCRQQAVDHYGEEGCIFGHSEAVKHEYILERFEQVFLRK